MGEVYEIKGPATRWLRQVVNIVHDESLQPGSVRGSRGRIFPHCQQAVEKALKGFLSWHDRPFGKTHELRYLGEQCIEEDPSLAGPLEKAFTLTDYAWKFRYPGAHEEPALGEAREALALAQGVVRVVLARVPIELPI
ncbi:MAG: HEPN domain-containing protein [Planctomycetota bacterium]